MIATYGRTASGAVAVCLWGLLLLLTSSTIDCIDMLSMVPRGEQTYTKKVEGHVYDNYCSQTTRKFGYDFNVTTAGTYDGFEYETVTKHNEDTRWSTRHIYPEDIVVNTWTKLVKGSDVTKLVVTGERDDPRIKKTVELKQKGNISKIVKTEWKHPSKTTFHDWEAGYRDLFFTQHVEFGGREALSVIILMICRSYPFTRTIITSNAVYHMIHDFEGFTIFASKVKLTKPMATLYKRKKTETPGEIDEKQERHHQKESGELYRPQLTNDIIRYAMLLREEAARQYEERVSSEYIEQLAVGKTRRDSNRTRLRKSQSSTINSSFGTRPPASESASEYSSVCQSSSRASSRKGTRKWERPTKSNAHGSSYRSDSVRSDSVRSDSVRSDSTYTNSKGGHHRENRSQDTPARSGYDTSDSGGPRRDSLHSARSHGLSNRQRHLKKQGASIHPPPANAHGSSYRSDSVRSDSVRSDSTYTNSKGGHHRENRSQDTPARSGYDTSDSGGPRRDSLHSARSHGLSNRQRHLK
eukprot:Lankesteria_metandrocarpae@DN4699_c0_g1_i11.p1